MREEHILISTDGPHNNIIKFKPPMVFTKENVDEVVSTLDRVLKEVRHNNNELSLTTVAKPVGEITVISKEHRPTRKPMFEDGIKSI